MRRITLLLVTFLVTSVSYAEDVYIDAQADALAYSREIVIFKSGYVYEEGHSTSVYKRLHPISKSDLKKIEQSIQTARFFDLPDRIEPKNHTEDGDTAYSIWIKTSRSEKLVDLEAPDRAKDPNAADRFMMVWDTINKIVPEKP